MPSKKVTLVHKDLPDTQIVRSERVAAILADSGWKPAPKSQQPTSD